MSGVCARHSHDLLAACRKKGMGSLVRPERSRLFAERWLAGTATKPEFDPYVVAVMEIFSKCKQMNIYVLPGACPVCTAAVAIQSVKTADSWIDNVTDLMLLTARVNHLVSAG